MKEQEMKRTDQKTLDMLRKINLCAAHNRKLSQLIMKLEEAKAEYEIKRKCTLGDMPFKLKAL